METSAIPLGLVTDATYLLTDSRQLLFPAQSLFFAIQGEHHDGHRFIGELYDKGVRRFVVETAALTPDAQHQLAGYSDAVIWEVASSLRALQALATRHRQKFSIPVVGITGSNGKTIVKEWLAQVLSPDFIIQKSPQSYNSQIGVPLSVWPLNEWHTLGIFEAGISRCHEMETLQPIIQPTIGIFTTIGPAHDEGFRSRKQKVVEKLRLFVQSDLLIYRKEYADIEEEVSLFLRAVNPAIRLLDWSTDQPASLRVQFEPSAGGTNLIVTWENRTYCVFVPFSDQASLENATHVLIASFVLGVVEESVLNSRFARLRPVSMRLEVKEGIHRNRLIDDTYNNDLAGLAIALNFLSQQGAAQQKVVVLSDILETGQRANELYADMARLVTEKGITHLLAVGSEISRYRQLFPMKAHFFETTPDLLKSGQLEAIYDSAILIKGARRFSFEQVVGRLVQKVHGTVLEVNLDALTHNLNVYRNKVGAQTKIMVMVKAFAYGSGSAEVAGLLQYHRVDYLAVAYADEGVFLRRNGIQLPIMVMNPSEQTFAQLLEYRLEPEIYSFRILTEWLDAIRNQSNPVPIHLKLDTGMHRLGFLPEEVPELAGRLATEPSLVVASIFSHLAGADEAHHAAFTHHQYDRFMEGVGQLSNKLGYQPLRHLLNSAGIIRFPHYTLDMVRLGIGLYGVAINQMEPERVLPVGTLKTVVSQIKHLKAGETVGYSRRGVLSQNARVATLAIGYADGYDRRLGNGVGQVWVKGVLCPTVGSICMDMTMVDVSKATVEEGDEVVLFGRELNVTELADRMGTIPYEVLTGINDRVKRVFYRE